MRSTNHELIQELKITQALQIESTKALQSQQAETNRVVMVLAQALASNASRPMLVRPGTSTDGSWQDVISPTLSRSQSEEIGTATTPEFQ